MLTLFDQPPKPEPPALAARRAKRAAIKQADESAPPSWHFDATAAVLFCAATNPDGFTSDDVWERMESEGTAGGANPAALGPVFLKLSNGHLIVKTGRLLPSRLSRRHRDLTEWISREPDQLERTA